MDRSTLRVCGARGAEGPLFDASFIVLASCNGRTYNNVIAPEQARVAGMLPLVAMGSPSERDRQLAYHEEADPAHLAWQTSAPFFAETEARLVEGVRCDPGERLLEIGCGEGGNLHHLRRLPGARYGVDF